MTREQRLEAALNNASQRIDALLDSETAGITAETGSELEQVLGIIAAALGHQAKDGAAR